MKSCPVCLAEFDPAVSGGPCPRCSLANALAATSRDNADEYDFVAELGRGGMGVVSLARQRSLDRLVALKVIATGSRDATRETSRLLREARAAAAIQHPNVVAVHDVGQGPAGAFIAMEYCEGGDLRELLRRGPLAPRAAAELGVKLAAAIERAHAAGILHRDLKPSNVLLTVSGEPKLSDFGLSASFAGTTGEFTRVGEVAGSPSYLAPESLEVGHVPTAAVDIYGLGAVLYESIAGRPPFTGNSAASVLAQISVMDPVAPQVLNPAVPADLDTIILKCLRKRPSARYGSAAELRGDLQAFLEGRPISARPISAAGRFARWARRKPALAISLVASLILLLTVTVGSTVAALRIEQEREQTALARDRALAAEKSAREQLRSALLAQAHATRVTGREGHRRDALDALRRAAAIRPGPDLRNEAVAALNLPEWTAPKEVKAWSDPGVSTVTPLPGFNEIIHETIGGRFTRRTYPEGRIVWTRDDLGAPTASQTVASPDGRWVALRLQNDTIHLLDAATGKTRFEIPGRPFAFKASRIWGYGSDMAFSLDGNRFAATRPEGGVSIHDMADGRQVAVWEADAWIVSLAFSHNGKWIVAGGSREREKNVVALIDAATGRELARDKPLSRVDFVAWSGDDRWLAIGSRPVQVRASVDFSIRAVMPDRNALHAHFLPGADRLLLTEQVGQTRLWDIDTGRLIVFKQDPGRPGVFYDGDPPRLWRYFSSGEVVIQTLEPSPIRVTHRPVKSNYTAPDQVDPLDMSPDGRWLLLGGWQQPMAIATDSGEGYPLGPMEKLGSKASARFEADGRAIWIGQSNSPLRRHRFEVDASGRPVVDEGEVVPGNEGFMPTAFHAATGMLALANYQAGLIRMFDTRARQKISEWPLPKAGRVAFSPDGRLALSNAEPSENSQPEVHEVANGKLVFTPGPPAGRVSAWHPNGETALVGGAVSEVGIWNTSRWQKTGRLLPGKLASNRTNADYSLDGRLLVVRTEGLTLLRVDTLEELVEIEIPDGIRPIIGVRFSADSRKLVLAQLDGRVDIWDLTALRAELGKLGLDWKD